MCTNFSWKYKKNGFELILWLKKGGWSYTRRGLIRGILRYMTRKTWKQVFKSIVVSPHVKWHFVFTETPTIQASPPNCASPFSKIFEPVRETRGQSRTGPSLPKASKNKPPDAAGKLKVAILQRSLMNLDEVRVKGKETRFINLMKSATGTALPANRQKNQSLNNSTLIPRGLSFDAIIVVVKGA